MDDSGFEIRGMKELQKAMGGVINRFPEEREKELLKLGYMLLREVVLLTPVKTGRLRASLTMAAGQTSSKESPSGEGSEGGIEKRGSETIEVGTKVKYAQAIEDGFTVNQRFVPGQWSGNTFKYNPGAKTGMTLHPQFVLGKHMFTQGMQNFEPKAKEELEKWAKKMLENIQKGNNDIASTFGN